MNAQPASGKRWRVQARNIRAYWTQCRREARRAEWSQFGTFGSKFSVSTVWGEDDASESVCLAVMLRNETESFTTALRRDSIFA